MIGVNKTKCSVVGTVVAIVAKHEIVFVRHNHWVETAMALFWRNFVSQDLSFFAGDLLVQ